jgi:Flp pilus assembly pilin Flp
MDWNGMILKIRHDQSGATLIEYALIIALIALGMMVGLNSFAVSMDQLWEFVRTNVLGGLGA